MAFLDLPLDAPLNADKGHEDGSCNRRSCQASPANYYNHGSRSWYCRDCAIAIGQDTLNLRDWEARYRPTLGHAMLETRSEIDARTAKTGSQCPNI